MCNKRKERTVHKTVDQFTIQAIRTLNMIRNQDTSPEQPAVQLEHQPSSCVPSRREEPLPHDGVSLLEVRGWE